MITEITNRAKIIFGRFEQKIDVIELDILQSRLISERTEITQNPVEGGFINDHIRDQPTEITMSALVSKFSIRYRNFGQANLGILASLVGGKVQNRLQLVHDQLYSLKDKKEPIILKMPRRDYPNMFITSLDFPSDPDDGQVLKFNISFKEVKFATSQTVAVDNSKIKTDSAKKKTNLGRQTAKPITPAVPTRPAGNISLLQFLSSPGGNF